MNAPSASQVAEAVRAVLAERAGRPWSVQHDGSTFDFAGRVLSLRAVEGLPDSIRRIAIPCGTVVTPLARDHLKRLGIAITLASSRAQSAAGQWAFATDGLSPRFAAYERLILNGPDVWTTLGPDLTTTSAWITSTHNGAGVILSECGAQTVWTLHREPSIRAALVHDAESLARASPFRPNVIVIEPAATSLLECRHLVSRFRRSSLTPDPCPPSSSRPGPNLGAFA